MRMPTSKSAEAKFRGPTQSSEYNQNEDLKYLDLIELYKQANLNELALREAHQAVLAENSALNDYVSMLEERMAALEGKLAIAIANSNLNGKFFKTGFVQDMTGTYPLQLQDDQVQTPRCEIDLQHRYVAAPKINQIPKTHIVSDTGEYIVPSQLKVKVGRTSEKGTVTENDILNAFNGDNLSFWRRSVTYDSPSDIPREGEDVILEIELPTNLVNNLNINTIMIQPHPERGVQIKNIEFQYNNGWQTIQGFRQNEITSITSDDYSPRRKWYFPNTAVQKVRITLVQKHPVMVNDKTVFTLGAQEIGIYLTMYEPGGGMILTPFDMEGLYNIESIEHVFLNRKAFSYPENMDHMLDGNIFDYELYVEELDQTLRPLQNADWNSQTAQRIWVKTHLYPDPYNGVNPCLHAVRLHYTKV